MQDVPTKYPQQTQGLRQSSEVVKTRTRSPSVKLAIFIAASRARKRCSHQAKHTIRGNLVDLLKLISREV